MPVASSELEKFGMSFHRLDNKTGPIDMTQIYYKFAFLRLPINLHCALRCDLIPRGSNMPNNFSELFLETIGNTHIE